MRKTSMYIGLGFLFVLSGVFAMQSYTHCQIPCGIYGDETRFTMMEEHLQTIEKAMVQLSVSMNADPPNGNQAVRWVMTKETHADDFSHIVTYYFLAQRIKPVEGDDGKEEYYKKLELVHNMVVFAMKCKQTDDVANVQKLRELVAEFKTVYFKA